MLHIIMLVVFTASFALSRIGKCTHRKLSAGLCIPHGAFRVQCHCIRPMAHILILEFCFASTVAMKHDAGHQR